MLRTIVVSFAKDIRVEPRHLSHYMAISRRGMDADRLGLRLPEQEKRS